jgi:antitoxin CptB
LILQALRHMTGARAPCKPANANRSLAMTETPETRIKRLRIRSWRRGMKEMDLILGPYADARLGAMGSAALDVYEALLAENDQDLLAWVTEALPAPDRHRAALDALRAHGAGGSGPAR